VLKTALEERIATLGHVGSWPEIVADLDSLTETEIEYDGKRFVVRFAAHGPRRRGLLNSADRKCSATLPARRKLRVRSAT
jgi:hypothetical protein